MTLNRPRSRSQDFGIKYVEYASRYDVGPNVVRVQSITAVLLRDSAFAVQLGVQCQTVVCLVCY